MRRFDAALTRLRRAHLRRVGWLVVIVGFGGVAVLLAVLVSGRATHGSRTIRRRRRRRRDSHIDFSVAATADVSTASNIQPLSLTLNGNQ